MSFTNIFYSLVVLKSFHYTIWAIYDEVKRQNVHDRTFKGPHNPTPPPSLPTTYYPMAESSISLWKDPDETRKLMHP